MARKQAVSYAVKFSDGETLSGLIEGTTDGNLLSKLQAKLRELLIGHNLDGGATIAFHVTPAEVDELANPER